jgi:phosphotransferase system  glucose/maltose/N-acetylglucosamine-specific IIC component
LGSATASASPPALIDYLPNFNIATRPLLIIVIGLVYAVVYCFLFRLLIRRFNLAMSGARKPRRLI